MDAAKVHLTVNYVPLIGSVLGLAMLFIGYWRKSGRALSIGLLLFCLTAAIALAVYATGEIAGKGTQFLIGTQFTNIQAHRSSALPTFIAVELTGIAAATAFVRRLRGSASEKWLIVILALGAITAGLAARTTWLGRQIYVTEIFQQGIQYGEQQLWHA